MTAGAIMKDVVGTYKASYSNSNVWDDFLWAWNVPASDTKIFHFVSKYYFILKTIRCFWHSLYTKDVHTKCGTNHQDLCQTLIMTFKRPNQIHRNVHGPTVINPLTPKLNPSAQCCLTRLFTGDFASWTGHFINICVKNQQMQQLFIQFINYVW
jgi:hypothetical protein